MQPSPDESRVVRMSGGTDRIRSRLEEIKESNRVSEDDGKAADRCGEAPQRNQSTDHLHPAAKQESATFKAKRAISNFIVQKNTHYLCFCGINSFIYNM